MRWIINITSSYLRFIVSMAVLLFMTPYIINHIGLQAYGLWSVIISIVGLLGLTDMGFATAAVKFIAEREGQNDIAGRNRVVGTLLFVYSILAVICLGFTALFTNTLFTNIAPGEFWQGMETAHNSKTLIWIVGVAMAISLPLSVFKALLMGAGRQDMVNVIAMIMLGGQAALTVLLLQLGLGVVALAWATAFTLVCQYLLLIPLAWHLLPEFNPSLDRLGLKQVGAMMSFACYAFIANAAVLLILRMDPLIIQHSMALSSVAIYAIAVKIAEQTLLFNKQFSNALMPLVCQSHSVGKHEICRRIFTQGSRLLLAIAMPFLGLLWVYAEDLILLWVGSDFLASANLLRLLLIAVLCSCIQLNAANVLGMCGQHRQVAAIMVASALLNLVLSLALIQHYGLSGVAFATLLSAFFIEMLLMLGLACGRLKVSLGQFVRIAFLPAALCSAPALSLAWYWGSPTSLAELLTKGAACGLLALLLFVGFGTNATQKATVINFIRAKLPGVKTCPISNS